jgi:hypothetical protein
VAHQAVQQGGCQHISLHLLLLLTELLPLLWQLLLTSSRIALST